MKSTTPAFIASTASGTSPWPVMTITGRSIADVLEPADQLQPSIPGIRTSVTTHAARASAATARKAAALA